MRFRLIEKAKLTRYIPLLICLVMVLAIVPSIAGPYYAFIVAYGLIMGIVGLGFNLLLGYTGLLSFGHAGFFGVGMYALALAMRYLHIDSLEILLLISLFSCLLVSLLLGLVASRLTAVYFALYMLAFGEIVYALVFKLYDITRGSDGLPVSLPSFLGLRFESRHVFLYDYYYYFIVVVFLMCTFLMWVIVNSPFGKTLQAIRDNEIRARFVGIPVERYKFVAFVISGLYTGLGGALFAPLNGHVSPEQIYYGFSGEIVYFVLLGGMRSFAGPIIGAFIYTFIKVYVATITMYWLFILGLTLIIMVLLFPGGIMGYFESLVKRRFEK